jgi:hypothetical protein
VLLYPLFVDLDNLARLFGTMLLSHGVPPLVLGFWRNYITRFEDAMTLIVRKIGYVILRRYHYPKRKGYQHIYFTLTSQRKVVERCPGAIFSI